MPVVSGRAGRLPVHVIQDKVEVQWERFQEDIVPIMGQSDLPKQALERCQPRYFFLDDICQGAMIFFCSSLAARVQTIVTLLEEGPIHYVFVQF